MADNKPLSLEDQKTIEQINYLKSQQQTAVEKRKTENVKRDILIKKRIEEAANDFKQLNFELHTRLRKVFGNDLPLKQCGLTPSQVCESNIAALNEICKQVQVFKFAESKEKPVKDE